MKKLFLLAALFTLLTGCLTAPIHAQVALKSSWCAKHAYKPHTLSVRVQDAETLPGQTKTIVFLTPGIPFQGVQVYKQNGSWATGAEINSGITYNLGVGSGTRDVADSGISVQPYILVGAALTAGGTSTTAGLKPSLVLAGDLYIETYIGFYYGYDLLNKLPEVGITGNVPIFKLTGGPGTIILNKF